MGVNIRQWLQNIEAQGQIARQVTIASDTQVRLKNARRQSKANPLSDEEKWATFFPEGIGKRAVSRVVIGADYQSSVNAQRVAEGKTPNFIPAPLWRGKGAADPQLPAYMSYHTGTAHQVLRGLPLESGGEVQKDWQEFYHRGTGNALTPEELAVAQRFMPKEGKNFRQGATFDEKGNVSVPGELEGKVPWRTFGAENITAIKRAEDEEFTPIESQYAVPADVLAGAGGGAQPPKKPPDAPAASPEPEGEDERAAADMASEGGPAAQDEVPATNNSIAGELAAAAAKVNWNKHASESEPDEKEPNNLPDPGDEAVRRQNAAHAYRQLGSIIGGAFGSLAGGPIGGSAGSALGGLLGQVAGGGEITVAQAASAATGVAGKAIGGPVGAAVAALGGLFGKSSSRGGAAGGTVGAATIGIGGGDDVIGLLTKIERHLFSIINDGIFIRGDHRRAAGSII